MNTEKAKTYGVRGYGMEPIGTDEQTKKIRQVLDKK